MQKEDKKNPKHLGKLAALDNLSLGLSMVFSVVIGYLIGYGLEKLTGYRWLLFLGIFWGLAAAFLNIYKAYKRARKEFDGMENDPRYSYRAKHGDKSIFDKNKDDDEDDGLNEFEK